jgi:hypothetical protein
MDSIAAEGFKGAVFDILAGRVRSEKNRVLIGERLVEVWDDHGDNEFRGAAFAVLSEYIKDAGQVVWCVDQIYEALYKHMDVGENFFGVVDED